MSRVDAARLSGRETPVTNCFSAREWRRQFCVSGRTGGCLSALLVSVPCPELTLCGYQDVKLQLLFQCQRVEETVLR